MKKRLMSGLLLASLLLGMISIGQTREIAYALDASTTTEAKQSDSSKDTNEKATEEESEAADDAIHISSTDDLVQLANDCKMDSWSDGICVVLDQDIDLSGIDFTPIVSFNGTFDGQGYTISNLTITGANSYNGLFGSLQKDAVVKNLKLTGSVNPSGSASNVGALAGRNLGTIENCTFSGLVSGTSDVGGLVGVNEDSGLIQGSVSRGNIIGTYMTGGIVGNNIGTVFNCENEALVNTINSDSSISVTDLDLNLSLDLGSIGSSSLVNTVSDTGGIAGYSCGNLLCCINRATIGYAHVGYNVGGIVGRSCGYLLSCSNEGNILGRKDIGGIIGQMEPNIITSVTASSLQNLKDQLDELNDMIDQTQADARGASQAVQDGIDDMADAVKKAASSVSNVKTTVTGGVDVDATGSASGSLDSSVGPNGDASISNDTTSTSSADGTSSSTDHTISGSVSASLDAGVNGDANATGNITGSVNIVANTNLGGVVAAINSLANEVTDIGDEIGGQSDILDEDLTNINDQLDEIYNSTFQTIDDLEAADLIKDSSDQGIDDLTFGKAALCENEGNVEGDINIGGICGIMAQEYSLDPEDDLSRSIDVYEKKSYEVKAVVFKCKNYGEVETRHSYAGGICGRADLGFLYKNENYGSISSEDGEYLGGIAGLNTTTIRKCYAKNRLQGQSYVGGICGSGIEENADETTSSVKDCVSFVAIEDAEEFYGAISGTENGSYSKNYFVSEELAGLDKLNSKGAAEPITYEELCQLEGLPDDFTQINVNFRVDDQLYCSVPVEYGGSLGESEIPAIPSQNGTYSRWDVSDFSNITFDMDVNAVYSDYTASIPGTAKRADGRNILFVLGNFTDDAGFDAQLESTDPDTVKSNLPTGTIALEVGESWKLTIPEDGLDTHMVRYLTPNAKTNLIRIYQKTADGYEEVESEVIGSYIAFEPSGNEVEFAAVKVFPWKYVILGAAALTLIIVLLILLLIYKGRAKRKHRKQLEQEAIALRRQQEEEARQREEEKLAQRQELQRKRQQAAKEAAELAAKQKAEERTRKQEDLKKANDEIIRALEADPNVSPAYVTMMKKSLEMMLVQNSEISLLQDMLEKKAAENIYDEELDDDARYDDWGIEDDAQGDTNNSDAYESEGFETENDYVEEAVTFESTEESADKPKRKKKGIIRILLRILLILLLLAAIAAGAFYIIRPNLANTAVCAIYLKELSSDDSLEMTLDATASIDEKETEFSLSLAKSATEDGEEVLIAEMGNLNWYYCDQTIYLENGSAWSISDLCPDYTSMIDTLCAISQDTKISYYKENSYNCYEFEAEGADADDLMGYLYPTENSDILETNELKVTVKALNRKVAEIDFEGEAEGTGNQTLKLSAVCTVTPESVRTEHEIPAEVLAAISDGDTSKARITQEMLTLLLKWSNTLGEDPLNAEVTLAADCGLLKLDTGFSYCRMTENGSETKSITMNGITVYFDEVGNVWDSNGNQVSGEMADLTQSLDLIELAHKLCMTTSTLVSEDEAGHTIYELSLDDDTMAEAVAAIAPALENTSVSLTDGKMIMTADADRVTELRFEFTGSVKALIAEASADFEADVLFK